MAYQTLRVREQPGLRFVPLYGPEAQNVVNVLRPYRQRWRCLSALSIRTLKTNRNRWQPLDRVTQILAVKTTTAAMIDAEVKAGIRRYVEEGSAPWSR